MTYKVIYMTGAPAAGKSSTAAELQRRVPALEVFEYGARLTQLVGGNEETELSQTLIREKSARIVTTKHVETLDAILIEFCRTRRAFNHVIIDSHPVTKEQFGFRVTSFSIEQIRAIEPSEIWVLYASGAETIRRIEATPAGRPLPSVWEADFHTQTQASVAVTYGVAAAVAVYLDTTIPREELVNRLIGRLAN
jgi:adenylate kinase